MTDYYAISHSTLEGLGDSIRSVTGSTKKFTPDEMMAEIENILNAATFILVDKDGNEYPAIYVESDIVLTATENDIRKGTTAVTADGMIEGTKEIPVYHTREGMVVVPVGGAFEIANFDRYKYTRLQALLCSDLVATRWVSINDKVYAVDSTAVVSEVTTDPNRKTIGFGIVNDTDKPCVIRYFTYKEEI